MSSSRYKAANNYCVPDQKRARNDPRVKLRLIKTVADVEVWLVDGRYIRGWNSKPIYLDFTEGGNYMAYPWMPREIWIDNSNESEWEAVYLHEITELNSMEEKLEEGEEADYDEDHEEYANPMEEKGRADIAKMGELIKKQEDKLVECHKKRNHRVLRRAVYK